jgi:hypothetical protein
MPATVIAADFKWSSSPVSPILFILPSLLLCEAIRTCKTGTCRYERHHATNVFLERDASRPEDTMTPWRACHATTARMTRQSSDVAMRSCRGVRWHGRRHCYLSRSCSSSHKHYFSMQTLRARKKTRTAPRLHQKCTKTPGDLWRKS